MQMRRLAIVISGLLVVSAIGFVDYSIGYDLSLSIFFLAPIFLVARYAGEYPGYFLAMSSAVTWLLIDRGLHPDASWAIHSLNLLFRIVVFIVFVNLFTRIQAVLADQRRIIAELHEAADKIKILGGLIPICSWCKKIRNDEGYWEQLELYIHTHSEAEFTHSICPECKVKVLPKRTKGAFTPPELTMTSGDREL